MRPQFVVPDASVVVKFFIPEVLSQQALSLLALVRKGEITLIAPYLLFCETGNILWKKRTKGEITSEEAAEIMQKVLALPIERIADSEIVERAVNISNKYVPSATVYDSMYVATALTQGAIFVTAGNKLSKKIFHESPDLSQYCLQIQEYLDRAAEADSTR